MLGKEGIGIWINRKDFFRGEKMLGKEGIGFEQRERIGILKCGVGCLCWFGICDFRKWFCWWVCSGSGSIDLCFVGQWENVGRRGRIGRWKLGFGISYRFGTYDIGIMSELVECF